MKQEAKKVLMVTGEASGDHHGALVVEALKSIEPNIAVTGIGGDELSRAGMNLLLHSRELSVVGLSEVLLHGRQIFKAFMTVKREILRSPPDLAVFIDYPEFNLRLAGIAKRRGVPVLYYISPQLWAWRKGRAKKIPRLVDKMAVIFPFEAPFYEKEGLDVEFVGHPLMDREILLKSRPEALRTFGLKDAWPILGLLPGSRKAEINSLLPSMLEAAGLILKKYPDAQFVLPRAPGIRSEHIQQVVDRGNIRVSIASESFNQAIAACDLALVASGTATLETAIMEKPMIILYRVSPLTYLIGRLLISVPCIGLVNIVAGKKIVPELIQGAAAPKRIAEEALQLLGSPPRMGSIRAELRRIKKALGDPGASQRVAEIIQGMLSGSSSDAVISTTGSKDSRVRG